MSVATTSSTATPSSSCSLYRGQVIAGPMVRVSSLGFRVLCANQGAGVVFTEEMVSAKLSKATREVVVYKIPKALLPTHDRATDMVTAANDEHFCFGEAAATQLVDVEVVEFVVYESFKNMRKRQVVFSTVARSAHNEQLLAGCNANSAPNGAGGCYYPEGRPLIAQLGAAEPSVAAAAALVVCEDVDGIDVNMGCPKKFSIENGMGAALMSAPDRAGAILRAINEAVNSTERISQRPGHRRIPISFKTRVFSDAAASVDQLRRVVESSGHCVHSITLHARTRDQRSETAPLQAHAELVVRHCREQHPQTFPAPLCFVFNGSVENHDQAGLFLLLSTSPFEGAMLSRSAMWDPSVFTANRHMTPPFTSDAASSEPISRVYKAVMLLHRAYHTNFTYVKYHMTRSFQEFPSVKKTIHPKMQAARTYGAFAALVGFDAETAEREFGAITFEELLPKDCAATPTDGGVRERETEVTIELQPPAKEARKEEPTP